MGGRERRVAAFTLIELMIVVAIIGILAAIALPAFLGYVKRSKTSEATSNLKSLYTAANAYYSGQRTSQGIAAVSAGNCWVGADGPAPAMIGADKVTYDFTTTAMMSFGALGFSIADPFYYQYTIWPGGGPPCTAWPPGTSIYTFQAHGDLDGNAALSLFELAVGVNNQNELFRAPGFYVQNELE